MILDNEEFPLLTIQEQHAAEAPRIYTPHTTSKPKTFDWDAITPTCSDCGTRTGQVNTDNGLCPDCDPTYVLEQAPTPTPVPRPARQPRRVGRPRLPFDVDAVIEAYTGGQMLTEISVALQVSYSRVRAAVADAGIELRDDRGRHSATRGCRHGNTAARTCEECREERNARRRINGPGRYVGSLPNTRNPIDEQAVLASYAEGRSASKIAADFGVTLKRIRDCIARHGIELRDDRCGNSGGHNAKTYDPDLVERIRHFYVDEHMTQMQTAEAVGSTIKIVQTVMVRHQIPRRSTASGLSRAGIGHPIKLQPEQVAEIVARYTNGERASVLAAAYDVSVPSIYHALDRRGIARHGIRMAPGVDGAAGLKAEIAEYGVPIPEIKAWGLREGLLMEIGPGIPPRRVFEAYVNAHHDGAA